MSEPVDAATGGPARDLSVAVCSPSCSGTTSFCNAMHHCVSCLLDNDCPLGTVCKVLGPAQSQCVKGCASNDRCPPSGTGGAAVCCNNVCIDASASANNCGACGNVCMVPNAVAKCSGGKCGVGACSPGYTDCNSDATDGCEVSVRVDPLNCTACGKTCAFTHGTAGCADGCYLTGCQAGYADCDSSDNNGCEVAVDSDPRNCGACGVTCTNPANAKGSCMNSACVLVCNLNWGDCDNNANNGCERPLVADANNCGACGNVCPNGLICKAGQCTCPNCNIPNASSKCVNNVCTLDKCNVNFGDCDNNANNGCETDVSGDTKNCGACGNVCPNNLPNCAAGVCINGWFPVGPQQNVPINMLAGWTQCYKDFFSNGGTSLATILQGCNGSRLMLACRQANSNTLTVLAQAPRADVIFDVGSGNGASHDANGTSWYYTGSWSWGFFSPGDGVSRNSCDTAQGANPANRLCWHTSGGNINGGYRCGTSAGLNGSNGWERLVYQMP